MNNNLLNIIKRIITEKGENILSDPQKLNPLFKDYAKDEPKDERAAFGRCIEIGAYRELKNTLPANRAVVKLSLVSKLESKTGFNTGLCIETINLLEAIIFNIPNNPPYNIPNTPLLNIPNNLQNNINNNITNNRRKVMNITMAKVGFFIGLINFLQLIIIIFNRERINLPEQDSIIIIFVWLIITVVAAITGFVISLNGYKENKTSQGFGIAGMALNGLVILPAIIFFLGTILDAFKNRKRTYIFK